MELDERKLLPEGVHDMDWAEVEALFGRFQRSTRRLDLTTKLKAYIREVASTGWQASLLLNGSYVMPIVDEPEDVDMILVVRPDWDYDVKLPPYQYNLVSKKHVRKNYGFDLFFATTGSTVEAEWIEFFQGVNPKWCTQFGWPKPLRKGIVRIVP